MKRFMKYFNSVIGYPIKIKNKISNKALNNFKSYALNKFIKSEYLRNTTNIIPLTLISTFIRIIINFLIISRIKTQNYVVNFIISTSTTIILSLMTPLFYDTICYIWENDVLFFTNIVVDNLWNDHEGDFLEMWKSRVFGSIAVLIFISLFFIEITSRSIQEFIVQILITGYITDNLNNYFLMLIQEKNNIEKIRSSPLQHKIIELPSNIQIVEKYNPNKKNYIMIDEYISLENGIISSHSSESLSENYDE